MIYYYYNYPKNKLIDYKFDKFRILISNPTSLIFLYFFVKKKKIQ